MQEGTDSEPEPLYLARRMAGRYRLPDELRRADPFSRQGG